MQRADDSVRLEKAAGAGAVELVSPGAWVVSDGGILRRSTAFPMVDAASQQARLERQDVTRVYERGDSLKNGMMIGLVTGAVVGIDRRRRQRHRLWRIL